MWIVLAELTNIKGIGPKTVSTLNKLTANKEIVYYKPGGKVSLFKVQDLRDFVEKGKINTNVDISSIAKEMIKNFKK